MEKTLEKGLENLSDEDKSTLSHLATLQKKEISIMNKEVLDRAHDRDWCRENEIDYVSPNLLRIAIYAYRELTKYGIISAN